MNELIYHTITPTAQEVGGDYMLILTADSTIDDIVQYILANKVIWFYDGAQIQAAAVWRKANGLWAKSDKTAIEAGKNYRMG